MNARYWAHADDLSALTVWGVGVVAVLAILLLVMESPGGRGPRVRVMVTGVVAVLALVLAVLRPIRVSEVGRALGARVVVLVDRSRRLELASDLTIDRSRWQRTRAALEALQKRYSDARLDVRYFAESPAHAAQQASAVTEGERSDLTAMLQQYLNETDVANSMVVVSDGRFESPAGASDIQALLPRGRGVRIHTVSVAHDDLPDVSIRAIRMPAAVVAHQAFNVDVDVGVSGGIEASSVRITARELLRGGRSAIQAGGDVKLDRGGGTIRLTMSLDRAGPRLVDVSISATPGDRVPDNDRRVITVPVTRDRIRLLHIAGRPTYDVRALRTWLKSDEALDVVTFFILRTRHDDANTVSDGELALIPFPVHELFTEHLSSFDAVIVQDIDAIEYELAEHLLALARYVESGGGLIMVGGPGAFAAGNYARTPIQSVLPAELSLPGRPFDGLEFTPRYTNAGRVAAVSRSLRQLVGERLPLMVGSNALGPLREGAIAIWEHPTRGLPDGTGMPVLALGRAGDGRSIALAVDGTHRLAYGALGAETDGRAYGALWDGMLGWLMRDPRYESAQVALRGPCIPGRTTEIVVSRVPGSTGKVGLSLQRLGDSERGAEVEGLDQRETLAVARFRAPETGGYSADVIVGDAPPTRFDFACELGGEAWSDSRPDPDRLADISAVSGGQAVAWNRVSELPGADSHSLISERRTAPVAPPWVWSLLAAVMLGTHWIQRRRAELP